MFPLNVTDYGGELNCILLCQSIMGINGGGYVKLNIDAILNSARDVRELET
jgi:hypothetical protein